MDDIYDEEVQVAPPPKKKSIFSVKARAPVSESAKAIDFFSRGRDTFERQQEEEKRRQQKKLAKLERKRSSKSAELKEDLPVEDKRRKVSTQKYTATGYSSDEGSQQGDAESPTHRRRGSSHSSPGSRKLSYTKPPSKNSSSLSERYSRDLNTQKSTPPKDTKAYICLSDSDEEDESEQKVAKGTKTMSIRLPVKKPISLSDDDDFYITPLKPKPIPIGDELSEEELDPAFAEFVQAARQREKLKLEQAAARASLREAESKPDDFDDFLSQKKAEIDPIVDILITSKIEGTSPLMVKRKLTQKLREVRYAWCDKQTYHGHTREDYRDQIFLTWKTHRLSDGNMCQSLVTINEDGEISYDADGVDNEGRIHLLAWTELAYKSYQSQVAEQEKKEQAKRDGKIEEKPAEAKLRLILKAQGKPDLKVKVTATTAIEKLIGVFRGENTVADDQVVSLFFDGEKLDPVSTIGENDIEDLDCVEIHIN